MKRFFFPFLMFCLSNALGAAEPCVQGDSCRIFVGIGLGTLPVSDELSEQQRQLMAVKAAKVDALRSLAEQIKGVRLKSASRVDAGAVVMERLETDIEATLVGVRYLKVEPIQPGIYQATAEIRLD